MIKTILSALIFTFLLNTSLKAQDEKFPEFIPSYDRFSSKNPVKIGLKNKTILEGTIKDLDRKKGLIEEIEIKPLESGKKQTLTPESMEYAYLEPSGLNKITTINANLGKINRVSGYDLDSDLINKGFVYFESSPTQIRKNKEDIILLQLLNPTFTGRLRIYDDPFAQSTMAVGFAGMTLAGGDAKSYFYKKDDKKAVRIMKKDFENPEAFSVFFSDCEPVLNYLEENEAKWHHLNEYVFIYNTECGE